MHEIFIDDFEAQDDPYVRLIAAEDNVSICAKEMLSGRSTKEEQYAFRSALNTYEKLLPDFVNMCVNEHPDDENGAREALVESAYESKRRIVGSAQFMHAEESLVTRKVTEFSLTRRKRLMGKLALASTLGVVGWSIAKTGEALTGVSGGVIGFVVGWTAQKGMRIKDYIKTLSSAGSRKVKEKGIGRLEAYDMEGVEEIVESIAHIKDDTERNRMLHREITDRYHLQDARLELLNTLYAMPLRTGEEKERAVFEAVRITVKSLEDVYSSELRASHREIEKVKAQA